MQRARLACPGLAFVAAPLLFVSGVRAQDQESLAQTLKEVRQEYQAAHDAWMRRYRATPEAQRNATFLDMPKTAEWFPRLWAAMEVDPRDDAVIDVARWIAANHSASDSDLERTFGLVLKHHADDSKLKTTLATVGQVLAPQAADFLKELETRSSVWEIKGIACFQRGECLQAQATLIGTLRTADARTLDSHYGFYGRDRMQALETADAFDLNKEAERCYNRVINTGTYARIQRRRGILGEAAKRNLFEIRNLSVGKTAPEIIGEDIDGNPMKLSDYRGKVVVLDFWGDW